MTGENSSYPVCSNHPDRPARWICPDCGEIFCEECVEPASQGYYCRDCVSSRVEEGAASGDGYRFPDFPRDANLVKRLLAFGYDFVFLLLLVILINVLIKLFFNPTTAMVNTLFFGFLYVGLLFRDLITPVGSPGKYLNELYVWDQRSDSRPGTLALVARNLFFPFFYFDVLPFPFTPHFQRLGELVSGTTVYDFNSRVDEEKYIYRLVGVTVALAVFMVLVLAIWLRGEVRERAWLDFSGEISTRASVVEQIESVLEPVGNLEIQPLGDETYRITAEFKSAEKYYTARRKIDRILSQNSHTIVGTRGPEAVLRGENQPYYRLELKIALDDTF